MNNNYPGATTTTTATSKDNSSNTKVVPVTPYCNTNNAIISTVPYPIDAGNQDQNSTGIRSAEIKISPPTTALPSSPSRSMESIANSSEIATLNRYNRLNELPKQLFFGSDLVRNPDGTPLLDNNQNTITIARMLGTKPLQSELATRPGPGGRKLTYLSGDSVTRTLNDIFGFDGWCLEVKETRRESCDKDSKGRYSVSYTSTVRVTHRISGAYKEDIGAGDATDKSLGTAVSNALKGSVTDAMKRAVRHFGDKLGNSCYEAKFSMSKAPKTLAEALRLYDAERAKSKFGAKSVSPPQQGHTPAISTPVVSSTVTKSAIAIPQKQQLQQAKPFQSNGNGYATPRSGQSDPMKNTMQEQKQKQLQQQNQHQQNTPANLHTPRQPSQSSSKQPTPSSSFVYKTNAPQSAHGAFPSTTIKATMKGAGSGGLSRFQQQHSSSLQSNQYLSNQHEKQQQYSNARNISSTALPTFVNPMQHQHQHQTTPKPKPPFASQSIQNSTTAKNFMSQKTQSTSSTAMAITATNNSGPLASSVNNVQPMERPLSTRGMDRVTNSAIVSSTPLSQSSQSSESLKQNQNSNGKRVLSGSSNHQPQNTAKKTATFTSANNPYSNNGKR